MKFTSINDIIEVYSDKECVHKLIAETLYNQTNEVPEYKALRDFVETNSYGHGERCFYALWDLIVKELPDNFSFAEIGVYKGQQLALVQTICNLQNKKSDIVAISPFDGTGDFAAGNYIKDVENLFAQFNLSVNTITPFVGLSTDKKIIQNVRNHVKSTRSFYALFIDGGHDYNTVTCDLINYTPLIQQNGFLVIDDCCNNLNLPKNYFPGIQSVTDAVYKWEDSNDSFQFLFSVGHNKVYRKL